MKRLLSISVLLQTFTVLIMSVLLVVLAIYAVQATRSERQARRVPVIVDLSNELFSSIQNVRLERAMVDESLRMPEPIDSATLNELAAQRVRFATVLDATLRKIAGTDMEGSGPRIMEIHKTLELLCRDAAKD